ncbi:hypothetical protein V499_05102 [Pseudogymnoascus sp. VKM F-103]|nr:hypothetical protein V499_05102 [Pseudogymnoascus sp. VKM F-103]
MAPLLKPSWMSASGKSSPADILNINLISSAAKSSSSNPHRFVNRGTLGRRKGQRIPLGGLSRRQRIARKGRSDTACSAFRLESLRKGRASRKPQQWAGGGPGLSGGMLDAGFLDLKKI